MQRPQPVKPIDIDDKLKRYMNLRDQKGINNLLGQQRIQTRQSTSKGQSSEKQTKVQNNDDPKNHFDIKKSILNTKYQKVQAHTEEQKNIMRQTNKILNDPSLKLLLFRGLQQNPQPQKISLTDALMIQSQNIQPSSQRKLSKGPTQKQMHVIESPKTSLHDSVKIKYLVKTATAKDQNDIPRPSSRNFNSMTSLCTPYGPARSKKSMEMKIILSGNFKEGQTINSGYVSVNRKDLQDFNQLIDKNQKLPKGFRANISKTSRNKQNIIKQLMCDEDFQKQAYSSFDHTDIRQLHHSKSELQMPSTNQQTVNEQPTYEVLSPTGSNNSDQVKDFKNFVKKVKRINTIELKNSKPYMRNIKSTRPQTAININQIYVPQQSYQELKSPSSSDLKSPANEITYISKINVPKEILNIDSKIASLEDKKGMDRFLNNTWLKFVIEKKSLRNWEQYDKYLDEEKNNKQQIQKQEEEKDFKNRIRSNFYQKKKNPENDSYFKSFSNNTSTKIDKVEQYLAKKRNKYAKMKKDEMKMQQKILSEAVFTIEKRDDENNLCEFDEYYQKRVKRTRIINKIITLIKRAQSLNLTIREVINQNLNKFQSYESMPSYAFFQFVKQSNFQKVQEFMEKHPKLLHELDEFENTPLNIAVQRGDYKLTFYFISQKANLDLRNKMNQKPLYFAIKNNDIHLMKLLLAFKANPWDYKMNLQKLCQSRYTLGLLKVSQYISIFNRVHIDCGYNLEDILTIQSEDFEKICLSFKKRIGSKIDLQNGKEEKTEYLSLDVEY